MTSDRSVSSDIKCPGCHFECKLVKYQCGRGKEFYDVAVAGGEVPVRRGPTLTPSERATRPDGRPPVDDRVMHAFNVLSHRMQESLADPDDRSVVLKLAQFHSFMSLPVLAKRMRLSQEELDVLLRQSEQAGLVAVETDERCGRIARLTEAGLQQAAVWKADRDGRNAAFLSALSDDEKEVLVALVRKLLGMGV